jgi:hypothetical protein
MGFVDPGMAGTARHSAEPIVSDGWTCVSMRRAWRVLWVAAALAACEDAVPGGPGAVTVSLVSPTGAEGAAVVALTGAGIGEVSGAGTRVFAAATPGGTRVVVVAEPAGALRFQVQVEDVTAPPTAALVEVADGEDRLRTSLQGYRLEVSR